MIIAAVAAACIAVSIVASKAGAAFPVRLVVCGDANGDEFVTVSDGVEVLRAAALLSSPCDLDTCDVDGSGAVTVSDAVNVLREASGLSSRHDCPANPSRTPLSTPTPTASNPSPATPSPAATPCVPNRQPCATTNECCAPSLFCTNSFGSEGTVKECEDIAALADLLTLRLTIDVPISEVEFHVAYSPTHARFSFCRINVDDLNMDVEQNLEAGTLTFTVTTTVESPSSFGVSCFGDFCFDPGEPIATVDSLRLDATPLALSHAGIRVTTTKGLPGCP